MAGKRILDVAALFNASRGVAQKHAALRSRQLELWSQTSSVAKAVKNQTDRVTETARAASFLASRLNESTPSWTAEAPQSAEEKGIPGRAAATRPPPKDGIDQVHVHARAESNASSDVVADEDLERRHKTDCQHQPDGTVPEPCDSKVLSSNLPKKLQQQFEHQIPSQSTDVEEEHSETDSAGQHDEDVFYTKPEHASPLSSSLPRIKVPKQTENMQSNREHVQDETVNPGAFAVSSVGEGSIPTVQAIPEKEEVLEGINTDLFYSPRVAKLLGGRTQTSQRGDLNMEAAVNRYPGRASETSGMKQGLEISTPEKAAPKERATMGARGADPDQLAKDIAGNASKVPGISSDAVSPASHYEMRQSKVPSSRIGRLWNYGGLAAGMFGGALTESLRRATGSGGEGSYMLSAGNMDRLVAKLSRMRGAALKLGQMMSFQDSKMLPAPIQQVLLRVQDSADYMPPSQRNRVLASNLGQDWRDMFEEFEEMPIAAASIGQVHRAKLKANGDRVAVKVQYPGVADSIDSDLSNLAVLLTASRLLPKGLFLEKTIANARTELAWECDYIREADCGQRFQRLLSNEHDIFVVPKIYREASGKQVLTMEYMDGIGVTKLKNSTQGQKDWIGTQILRLCLREITEFKFMQTDPNWTNFLYNADANKLELLDFGASREYPAEFISRYMRLLLAASKSDKGTVLSLSIDLGYLTGHESKAMLNAHIASVMTLAEPFLASSPEVYDFRDQTITERVKALIPVMVRERLAPPPEETYSLHRKLSGAFLLCARLGSRVRCRELFENSMSRAGLLS